MPNIHKFYFLVFAIITFMYLFLSACLVYSTPTQYRLYSAETRKMTLANLGGYKLKATPGSKPLHLLELRDAYTAVI
jgi:hypothetical protein